MTSYELKLRKAAFDHLQCLKFVYSNYDGSFREGVKEVHIAWTHDCNVNIFRFLFNVEQLKFTRLLCPYGKTLIEFTDDEGCITNMTKMH
jgi:hypothetical protein